MSKAKRILALMMAVVMITGSVSMTGQAATKKKPVKKSVKSVSITNVSSGTLVLKKGKTFKLKTKVTVTGKASKKVSFSSSNKKIATVSKSGKIKAVKKGTAKITVKSTANKKKKAAIKVIVGTPVTKVSLNLKKAEAFEGETITLKATFSPKKPSIKKVTYRSSNKAVATVSSNGVVSCKKAGTATITAEAADGSKKKATCKVTVKKKAEPTTENKTTEDKTTENKTTENKTTEKQTTEKPAKPEEPTKPEQPTEEDTSKNITQYEGYELVWHDEFSEDTLNRDDWNVELHEPGWVNKEWQEYVDSEQNIYLEDGKLVIKPVKTVKGDKATYTSGRINTQGNHDFKYGRFEARVKVPTGKGYLPAFWMMPTNENLYGQWPRCGEIDIMEVMGQETNKNYGTIHYGNPHAQKQGTNVLTSGNFSEDYHTFAVDWEPGKIVWYVDGKPFYEAKDWYSTTEGQGTVAYPAPFDQKFYMILNLAIGGEWVGYPDDNTTYEDQAFTVDYVRAYQRKDKSYYDDLEAKVEKPVKPPVKEPADGVYIKNGDFKKADAFTGKEDSVWEFMLQSDGEAEAAIVEDTNFGEGAKAVKISTTKAGSLDYSVQFVQANIPVMRGTEYTVTFDAYAKNPRTMIVDVSAPEYNYSRYMSDTKVSLTTEKQTFSYDFTVTDHDDANARLEFNLGNVENASDVFISNVKMEKKGKVDIDTSKKVLTDGNAVYNGKFQEGTQAGKKYLEYWDIVGNSNNAVYSVTGIDDGRRFKITTSNCSKSEEVKLQQTELPLTTGKYELSFDAQLDADSTKDSVAIKVKVANQEIKTFDITKEAEKQIFKFEIPEGTNITENDDIVFELGVNATVYLDNIQVVEDALIKNGSFNADTAGYEWYTDSAADASWVVDSINETNVAADVTINNTGKEDYHIQLKQNNVGLEKGKWYKLGFKAKTNLEGGRKIRVIMQGGESKDWAVYSGENIVDLTDTYQEFTKVFKMKEDTDPEAFLSICLGKVDEVITTQHNVCIDDIYLVETEPVVTPDPEQTIGENLLLNGDFADEGTNWSAFVDQGAGYTADAQSDFSKGNAGFTIGNTGTQDWHIQLKQENVALVKDRCYKLSFKIKSDMARSIKYAIQQNGGDYTPYANNKGSAVELSANDEYTVISEEFKMLADTDLNAVFNIAMGAPKSGAITKTHHIYIDDVKLERIESLSSVEPEQPQITTQPVNINLLKNPTFETVTDGNAANWSKYIDTNAAANVSFNAEAKTATYEITNVGTADWNVQLKQTGITLETGCTYRVTFNATSTEARTIKVALLNATNDWYGGSDIVLEKGTLKPVQFEFTVDADKQSDSNMAFQVSMGKIEDVDTPASTITLSNFSLVKLPASGE